MIKIRVSASKEYDVIMDKGILSAAGSYVREALCGSDNDTCLLYTSPSPRDS